MIKENKSEKQEGLLRKENDNHVDKSEQALCSVTIMTANLQAKERTG